MTTAVSAGKGDAGLAITTKIKTVSKLNVWSSSYYQAFMVGDYHTVVIHSYRHWEACNGVSWSHRNPPKQVTTSMSLYKVVELSWILRSAVYIYLAKSTPFSLGSMSTYPWTTCIRCGKKCPMETSLVHKHASKLSYAQNYILRSKPLVATSLKLKMC